MSRMGSLGTRLYRGEVSFDIVGRRRLWYTISLAILVVSVGSLALRGVTLGIEFKGGAEFIAVTHTGSVSQAEHALSGIKGIGNEPIVQAVGQNRVRVQTPEVSQPKADEIQNKLADAYNIPSTEVQSQRIGPTWGSEISRKALTGLIVFLALVVVYLSLAFEWKMAVAALVALLHDLLITTGVYSLVGFEVTPGTVIGLLTILGYSLYDTVVIFDKVKENTAGLAGGARMTYSGAANLALNQTLVRSINTSVTALLPVAGLLFIGAGLLGAGTLKDLALVLFIGMAAGTYSSIFIATPVLADLKEREPGLQALARRVAARQQPGGAGTSSRQPVAARTGSSRGDSAARSAEESGPSEEPTPSQEPGSSSGERRTPARSGASSRSSSSQRSQPRRPGSKSGRPGGKKKRR